MKKNSNGKSPETLASPSNGLENGNAKSSLQKVPNGPEPNPRKADALVRLGVTPQQLEVAPNLDPILKDTCGGKTRAIDAMRFSDAPLVEQFLAKYDSIPDR